MQLINISTFPPPIGGISKFIKRLKEHTENSDIETIFYDISGIAKEEKEKQGIICFGIVKTFLDVFFKKKSIVILHSARPAAIIGCWILGIKHTSVLMLHNERIFGEKKSLKDKIINYFFKRINYYIAVSENIKDRLIKESMISEKKIYVFEPYLLSDLYSSPINEKKLFELRKKVDFLIYSYAYKWEVYQDEDLYGTDLVVDLVIRLQKNGYNVGAILQIPNHENVPLYIELVKKIKEAKLENEILFLPKYYESSKDFYTTADIHIRATNTDGCSTSIFESLMYGTPTIASDCVPRFDGTILFKNRNIDSLYEITKNVIDNLKEYKEKLKEMNFFDSKEKLYKILFEIQNK